MLGMDAIDQTIVLIDRARAVTGVQATMTTLALSSLHGTMEAAT
jgi:hypothetical protein